MHGACLLCCLMAASYGCLQLPWLSMILIGFLPLQRATVIADVAEVSADHPTFPGHHGEVSTAVCFSGGGGRAMSMALGQYRALEALGLISHVDAISSASGGTYASAIYMFANVSTETLLGKASIPEQLTMDTLKQDPPAMGKTMLTSLTSTVFKLLREGVPLGRIWRSAVSHMFLKPFGLWDDAHPRYMASNTEAVARIVERNPTMDRNDFTIPIAGRPKVFVMGGTLQAPTGYTDNHTTFQMSPDFVGIPFFPDGNGKVCYGGGWASLHFSSICKVTGGGLVEAFAFGGDSAPKRAGESVNVSAPAVPFTLGDAVGISSTFYGFVTLPTAISKHILPTFNYWPVPSSKATEPAATIYQFGDGGDIDNTGLLPMLQRGAKRVAWFLNTETGFSNQSSLCDNSSSTRDTGSSCKIFSCSQSYGPTTCENKHCLCKEGYFSHKGICSEGGPGGFFPIGLMTSDLYMLFGYAETGTDDYYVSNQVFAKEELQPMACGLQKLRNEGKPAVWRSSLHVLPNSWWGIQGGFTLESLHVYNERCDKFENLLPKDTQDEIRKGSKGLLPAFPFMSTSVVQATSPLINLMSAQTEFIVRESEAVFKELLTSHSQDSSPTLV